MTLPDILSILQWWFFIFIIGIGFLPLASLLFSPFIDRGYIFAKIVGIAILSYAIFILGTLHLVPFFRMPVIILLITFIVTSYILFARKSIKITKENISLFAVEEVIFLAGLFFWAYIRSFNPDIHGLEKFMDYGFINSILRSEYFPPRDMWLTPFSINYYYFGHFTTAVLTRLSGIPPNITYNLMLATIFGFCLTGSFSIAVNLYAKLKDHVRLSIPKLLGVGMVSALLVTLSGNLHVLYSFFEAYDLEKPVPIWELTFQPFTFPNNYWYPNATRFIYNTIHEFPMYSWTVADLHGHVTDIAFVTLTIALLLSLFLKTESLRLLSPAVRLNDSLRVKDWKKYLWHVVTIGFMTGIMYMTNAWDGFIYFLLSLLVLFAITLIASSGEIFQRLQNAVLSALLPAGILVAGIVFTILPFSLFFDPGSLVSGIGVLCAPEFLTNIGRIGPFLFEADHCQRSPFWQLLMLYGFFYFFVLTFLIFLARIKKIERTDIFVFLLLILACALINVPEFLYAKDIYPDHYRANTMFKLVFQAFILLSLVSGYVLMRMLTLYKEKHLDMKGKALLTLWVVAAWVLLTIVFIYPFLATKSYYNELKTFHGLSGISYLQNLHPDDYEAVNWINANITGQPVILEAQGDSYTDYARISSNTGLPTVLGWTVHEWLWRGSYDIPSPRIAEVQTLYESDDLAETKSLLEKYDVEYVYFGDLEREKYQNINEEKWSELGTVIYSTGNTVIYKLDETGE